MDLKRVLSLIVLRIVALSILCTGATNATSDVSTASDIRSKIITPFNKTEEVELIKAFIELQNSKNELTSGKQSSLKQKIESTLHARGGISDGGGNAVRGVLFDFIENEGSFEVSPSAILTWNPVVQNVLVKANRLIPKINFDYGHGLGDQIAEGIRSRKWLIETKTITKDSCINGTYFEIERQIVACQNFYEVRILADWILYPGRDDRTAKDDFQIGNLFIHEGTLAWINAVDSNSTKEDREFKVREIVRLINEASDSHDLSNRLRRLLPDFYFLTAEQGGFVASLPIELIKVRHNFCHLNSSDDYSRVMTMHRNNPIAHKLIESTFGLFLQFVRLSAVYDSVSRVKTSAASQERMLELRRSFCEPEDAKLPDLKNVELNLDLLPKLCIEHVEKTFEHYVDIHQNVKHKIFENETANQFLKSANTLMLSTGILCRGLKLIELQKNPISVLFSVEIAHRKASEVELTAIKYFVSLRDDYLKTQLK